MSEREIFIAFVSNKLHTREGYLKAKNYYLISATPEEKRYYEIYMDGLSKIISKSYTKSLTHFKGIIKRYGLTEEEGMDLINKKNSMDALSFLNKFSNSEQESFLKELYAKCEGVRWNKEALKELANSYEISYELLINLISYYIKEVLKNSKTKTNYILRRIEGSVYLNAFIKTKTITNFNELTWYVRTYGSNTEQEAFFITLKEIIAEFNSEDASINRIAKLIARKYNIDEIEAKMLVMSFLDIEAKRVTADLINHDETMPKAL